MSRRTEPGTVNFNFAVPEELNNEIEEIRKIESPEPLKQTYLIELLKIGVQIRKKKLEKKIALKSSKR